MTDKPIFSYCATSDADIGARYKVLPKKDQLMVTFSSDESNEYRGFSLRAIFKMISDWLISHENFTSIIENRKKI